MNSVVKAFKKALKLIFNRIFYVVVAILLQVAWLFLLLVRLYQYSPYISAGMNLVAILLVLWIVNKKWNPSYKIGWTILIMALPIFGVMCYFLFGRSRIAGEMQEHYLQVQSESAPYLMQDNRVVNRLKEFDLSASVQSRYIYERSGFPVHGRTTAKYFQVGDDMFPALVRELECARHYIYIEYFIINDGVMWRTILDILERKAKEGVDVRLIYDGLGCMTTLPPHYEKTLNEKGIKCVIFNRFRPIVNVILNNRDHRKICVIDGQTGFTGGINLSDEYINQKRRFGHWKDTAVMLKGEAVWNMTVMFLHMWSVITKTEEPLDHEPYKPHKYHPDRFPDDGFVQPFSDTPLDGEVVGENVYLNIINRARRYVYICTPYLIIDNEMMTALCLAAKSGIDVRIMTPGIPDKRIVFWLTQSYYEQLLEAGVKIYEYQPGFLHAKSFVCDDEIAVVGTINLDFRSLYLHFENGVWFCNNSVISDILADFLETLHYCKPVSIEFCRNRNIFIRAMQSIMRLFAPLL